jgi:hypothetical protein
MYWYGIGFFLPILARDQQKWYPVLRPIARQIIKRAHDLFAKPLTLWRIMRGLLSGLRPI